MQEPLLAHLEMLRIHYFTLLKCKDFYMEPMIAPKISPSPTPASFFGSGIGSYIELAYFILLQIHKPVPVSLVTRPKAL